MESQSQISEFRNNIVSSKCIHIVIYRNYVVCLYEGLITWL